MTGTCQPERILKKEQPDSPAALTNLGRTVISG